MIFYHGSKTIIRNPIYKGSDSFNDYGPSFYLTTDITGAKSWACKNDSIGFVNKYYVDNNIFSHLKILDLTNKNEFNILNWIAILMHFRVLDASFQKNNRQTLEWLQKFYINVDEYDVIIGYRADDSYFRFPIRFITNELSYDDLEKVYLSGDLGIQYAFMSEKAIKALKFESFIKCEESFIGHHYAIVKEASDYFDELLNKPRDLNKTYILDLMRKDNEH